MMMIIIVISDDVKINCFLFCYPVSSGDDE